MKWIKLYEDFENHHLDQTFWEVTRGDQTLRVTLGMFWILSMVDIR